MVQDPRLLTIHRWLLSEDANGIGPIRAGEQLCRRLIEMGVPLSRGHVLVLTIHPLYHGRSFLWTREQGVQERNWPHGIQQQPGWRESLFRDLIEGDIGPQCRFDLSDPNAGAGYVLTEELRREGTTDYLAFRLHFADGSAHAASFATCAPGGFTEADRTLLFGLERILALRLEGAIKRLLTTTILSTYLGKHAADRVLRGDIRRDNMETTSAAIWMSDLRGFTALSDTLPPKTLLDLLGNYFTLVVEAVQGEGGEVLKFIGDAVLAVFRVEDGSPSEACSAAARAVRTLRTRLAEHNATRVEEGKAPIVHGLGLHFGQVSYGNVGSQDRLDFTVIGRTVNMASRIEGLCKHVGQSVLMSEVFAQHLSIPIEPFGSHSVRGVSEPVTVYGLPEFLD